MWSRSFGPWSAGSPVSAVCPTVRDVADPIVMGVLNVTPDSFSDGGLYLRADDAVAHAREMVEQGAEIVDVGGESTRPGAAPVSEAAELERVVPVVERVAAATDARVSIDTTKLAVA